MKASTQHVLDLLRSGPQTTGSFARNYAPRAAARICELRALGFVIESRRERDNAYTFTLISEPEPSADATPAPCVGVGLGIAGPNSVPATAPSSADKATEGSEEGRGNAATLFEVPTAPRRPGLFDPDEAAA